MLQLLNNIVDRIRGQCHLKLPMVLLNDDDNVENLNDANTLMHNYPDKMVAAVVAAVVVVCNPCTLCLVASDIAAAAFFRFNATCLFSLLVLNKFFTNPHKKKLKFKIFVRFMCEISVNQHSCLHSFFTKIFVQKRFFFSFNLFQLFNLYFT